MTSSNTNRSLSRPGSFDLGRFYIPALVAFGLILRLAIVCREEFYLERDSIFYIRLARDFDLVNFHSGAYPGPLFIMILKAITALIPSHAITAALALNISISLVGTVVFYRILQELDFEHGRLLAFLFAAHPLVIRNSCQILREPGYLTFMLLCGYFLIIALKRKHYPWLVLSGFCSLIAALFRYEAGEIWLLFPLLLYPCTRDADGHRRGAVKAAVFFYLPILLTALILWAVYPGLVSFVIRRIVLFVNRFIH